VKRSRRARPSPSSAVSSTAADFLPPGYNIQLQGGSEQLEKSSSGVGFTFLLALALVGMMTSLTIIMATLVPALGFGTGVELSGSLDGGGSRRHAQLDAAESGGGSSGVLAGGVRTRAAGGGIPARPGRSSAGRAAGATGADGKPRDVTTVASSPRCLLTSPNRAFAIDGLS
jgi:hypothetical protein